MELRDRSEIQVDIRAGNEADLQAVHSLIGELAAYERAADEFVLTEEQLKKDFEQKCFDLLVAEVEGEVLGIALYFYAYSTWKGRVLYLEDFVIRQSARRMGLGSRLFDALIVKAKEEKVGRFAWQVLDWNEPAIGFYKKYKAILEPGWVNGKLTPELLNTL